MSPPWTDDEDDAPMWEEVHAWNKRLAAYMRQLEEVQDRIREINKTRSVNVDLLAEKQKLEEEYNMYLSFQNYSEDLTRAYVRILYERHRVLVELRELELKSSSPVLAPAVSTT